MPATLIPFKDVNRAPAKVYLDTSFVRALLQWQRDGPAEPVVAQSYEFYDKVRRSGGRMWTAPFTVEEIVWAFVRRALIAQMGSLGYSTIDELKRLRRDEYDRVLVSSRQPIGVMLAALRRLRINFEFPNESAGLKGTWGALVVSYAAQILDRYTLETFDAFHAACAFVAGTSEIASLDAGFRQLEGFTVYSYV